MEHSSEGRGLRSGGAVASRFVELDGLRGLAALGVVVYHFTTAFSLDHPDAPPGSVALPFGEFGVQLFFVISGFVILMSADRARRPSDFAISRVSRLYPAYWIAVVVSIVVGALARVPGTDLTPLELLLNFTMVQRLLLVPNVNGAFWTLAVEMQFYLLVLLVLVLTKCRFTDRLVRVLAVVWLGVAATASVAAHLVSGGVDVVSAPVAVRVLANLTLAEYGPLFCVGMLLFLSRRQGRFELLAVPAALIAALNAQLLHGGPDGAVVLGVCAAVAVVAMRRRTAVLRWAPLLWLGRISYSLYILHLVVGSAIVSALWPLIGRDGAGLVAFVVVLLLSWGLNAVAEERWSPAWRRALTRRRDRRLPAGTATAA
ncbi:hypothetical protein C5C53_00220 [Rathayibacter sp. AY1E3]|nr:hypothetical protein C5C53_00220 [Rathayibacter sp. AY1E3]